MHLELLVEEPSAEAALIELLPKIFQRDTTFNIHPHGGKTDLLSELPRRLRGYRTWIPNDWRIVVLIDEDRQDCMALKMNLERIAADAGFRTRTNPEDDGSFIIVNRIAVEELEAWFFGDVEALTLAYPGVSPTLAKKRGFRNPDAVGGGTWEALERILKKAGHCLGGYPKIDGARSIAHHMEPLRNTSKSFNGFAQGIQAAEV